MTSRWHRRTAIAIGIVAIVCAVVGGVPIIVDAVQQTRTRARLIGGWSNVEAKPPQCIEFFPDGTFWWSLRDRRHSSDVPWVFEILTDELILRDPTHRETRTLVWQFRFDAGGRLVLTSESEKSRIVLTMRRVETDGPNADHDRASAVPTQSR